jgi:hypothetical protein
MACRRKDWIMSGSIERLDIVQPDAVDPGRREDVPISQFPFRLRHAKAWIGFGVLPEFRNGGCFESEIHFDCDGPRERLDDFLRAQAARFGQDSLDDPGRGAHRTKVTREAIADSGTDHLHGDVERALRGPDASLVDLGDRRRRDRFRETLEQSIDGLTECRFDDPYRLLARKRRHAVLELLEIVRGRNADDVGTCGQELAEFHIGWAKPGQGGGKPVGASADPGALDQPRGPPGEPRRGRQHGRIDERERSFAGENEPGAEVAGEVDDGADHDGSDLPAGMDRDDAAGQDAMAHPLEAGILDHGRKGCRRREAPDRFDEIPV